MARSLFAGILPSKLEKLLGRCAERLEEGDLPRAWVCYGEALKRDGGNETALRGRNGIESGYQKRLRQALERWDFGGARRVVEEFEELAPWAAQVRTRVREWRAEIEGARTFQDCEGCPEMVVLSAGSYEMGSPAGEKARFKNEGPLTEVTIVEPLAVGKYEVTVGEFRRFVEATGYSTGDGCRAYAGVEWERHSGFGWRQPGFDQTERHPVVCVSWEDAQAYVDWLSGATGERYRLLSESEWEYAVRGGTRAARYWGEGETGQCQHANGGDEALKRRYGRWQPPIASCDDGHVHTTTVGSYRSNGNGLYDMLGNVWEWVEDCWHESHSGAPSDGSARGGTEREDCEMRVMRGGSWDNDPVYLRSASRYEFHTGNQYYSVGIRVARTLNP